MIKKTWYFLNLHKYNMMIALNRSSTCSCTDSQTNKCLFLLLLWQGWVFLGLKNWSAIFWMARSQYFGNILREPPQTSTTTCKWPSTFHITLQRSSAKCDCEFSLWNSEKWSVVTRDRFIFFSFFFVVVTRHDEEWAIVESCTGITQAYCELSSLIQNYRTSYKVKVQLVAGVNESAWAIKRFLPNLSKNLGMSLISVILYS